MPPPPRVSTVISLSVLLLLLLCGLSLTGATAPEVGAGRVKRLQLTAAQSSPASSPAVEAEDDDEEEEEEGCQHESEYAGDYCAYLQTHCDFETQINYMQLYYCQLPKPLALVLVGLLLPVLFYAMGLTADSFFCPVLDRLAVKLHMSDEVAGLTILALGNGAADVSATFAAINKNKFGIAIGELLGAGLFVSTVVIFAITMVKETDLDKGAFLRDICFYLVGLCGFSVIVYTGKIYYWEALLVIAYYFVYVGFAISRHYYHQHQEGARLAQYESVKDATVDWVDDDTRLLEMQSFLEDDEEEEEAFIETFEDPEAGMLTVWSLQVWREEYSGMSTFGKIMYFLLAPVWGAMAVSIPDMGSWNRYLIIAHPVASPLFFLLGSGYFFSTVNIGSAEVPLAPIVLGACAIISVVVFFLTRASKKKILVPGPIVGVLNFVSLVMSVVWIYLLATELVGLLQTIGVIFFIPDVILGATILAWGNSVGDTISNIVMAKQGSPRMAITACYGGPVFNLFFGLGASLTYKCVMTLPTPFALEASHLYYVTGGFVVFSLLFTLLVIALLTKYFLSKRVTYALLAIYLLYTVFAILTALGVLWPEN